MCEQEPVTVPAAPQKVSVVMDGILRRESRRSAAIHADAEPCGQVIAGRPGNDRESPDRSPLDYSNRSNSAVNSLNRCNVV